MWMNDLAVVTLIFGNLMYSVHKSKSGKESSEETADRDKERIGDDIRQFLSNDHRSRNTSDLAPDSHVPNALPMKTDRTPNGKPKKLPPVSSLSMPSGADFSRGSSQKSVSFNENVSISEFPVVDPVEHSQTLKDTRFGTIKIKDAPLAPSQRPSDRFTEATILQWPMANENTSRESSKRKDAVDTRPNLPIRIIEDPGNNNSLECSGRVSLDSHLTGPKSVVSSRPFSILVR